MNKIVAVLWKCDPCNLSVPIDVKDKLVIKYVDLEDRMCALCGNLMFKAFLHADVEIGYRMGLDNGKEPTWAANGIAVKDLPPSSVSAH